MGNYYKHWLICQALNCGRCIEDKPQAWGREHWLVHPWVYDPDVNIIRCPEHWTDHALRVTIGRSTENRIRMARAKKWAKANLPPARGIAEPYPARDEPLNVLLRTDDEEAATVGVYFDVRK